MEDVEYAGFWIRTGAAIIDSLLILIVITPLLTAMYGVSYWEDSPSLNANWDLLFNYVLPAVAVLSFWIYKSATPGKMVTKLIIVDATSGKQPTTNQFIIRYLGYYISTIPFGLGILWIAFDHRKQGWHDKIANTVVIKNKSG